jgi:dihydroorotate dehydrogenase (NAD+) catalytic subunit
VVLDWGHGLINAIGLTNPGAEEEARLLAETQTQLRPLGVPLIASIFAGTVAEFAQVARTVATAQPDLISGRPVLSNRVGGISGPALKPIALRCVYEIAQAVSVPIIGTGGVSTGRDAAEMLLAGATVVGVGSAVYYRGVTALEQIGQELTAFMEERRISSVEALRVRG